MFLLLSLCLSNLLTNANKQAKGSSIISTTPLLEDAKDLIVREHNIYRQSNSTSLKMRWSDEAEAAAISISNRCQFDEISDQRKPRHNIYTVNGKISVNKLIKAAIKKWNIEKIFRQVNIRGSSTVVWAPDYIVGCGATTCSDLCVNGRTWEIAQILVCVYEI